MISNLIKVVVISFQLIMGLFLLTNEIYSQSPPSPSLTAQNEAMKKLEKMVGNWQGQGWYEIQPGQRANFKSMEVIEKKLNGLIISVEGIHKAQIPNQPEERVVHHALALISYNPELKLYSFRAHLANGNSSNAEASINQDGDFVWGFQVPNKEHYRYKITINDKGQWLEVGELSADGNNWRKFFEMNLHKQ